MLGVCALCIVSAPACVCGWTVSPSARFFAPYTRPKWLDFFAVYLTDYFECIYMFGNVISVLAGHISVTRSDGTKCFQGSPAAVWVM